MCPLASCTMGARIIPILSGIAGMQIREQLIHSYHHSAHPETEIGSGELFSREPPELNPPPPVPSPPPPAPKLPPALPPGPGIPPQPGNPPYQPQVAIAAPAQEAYPSSVLGLASVMVVFVLAFSSGHLVRYAFAQYQQHLSEQPSPWTRPAGATGHEKVLETYPGESEDESYQESEHGSCVSSRSQPRSRVGVELSPILSAPSRSLHGSQVGV